MLSELFRSGLKWSKKAHKKQKVSPKTVLVLDLFKKIFDPLNEDEFVDFLRYQTAAMFPAELTYDFLHQEIRK